MTDKPTTEAEVVKASFLKGLEVIEERLPEFAEFVRSRVFVSLDGQSWVYLPKDGDPEFILDKRDPKFAVDDKARRTTSDRCTE